MISHAEGLRYRAAAKQINLMTDQLSTLVVGCVRLRKVAPELEELEAFVESAMTMFDQLLAMAKRLEGNLDEELRK